MLEYLRRQLAALLEQRAASKAAGEAIVERAQADKRDLSDEEQREVDQAIADVEKRDEEIPALQERIKKAEEAETRAAAAGQARAGTLPADGPATVTSEPDVYARGGQTSYFRDLASAAGLLGDQRAAADRLTRSSKQTADQLRQRAAKGDLQARALNLSDGTGGELVPPLWLMDEVVQLRRAKRVVADQLTGRPLPTGTDSINLPKIATGTAVADHTINAAVQETDFTTTAVEAKVHTVAGGQTVPLELIEQSPVNIDDFVLTDLAGDYNTKVDVYVLTSNSAGKRGLLNVTGKIAVTYTDATPTVGELHPKGADVVQQMASTLFAVPNKVFMHPRRWYWYTAAVDSQSRPLVLPASHMPQNVLASMQNVIAEGFVGITAQGLPVYIDPNIPTGLGTGTDEDVILYVDSDQLYLYEGSPRAEAFRETSAKTMQVFFRLYNYLALHSERYPKAIGTIGGTGLVTPTF
ncbi:MAG: phage major capsid protein [Actinomycetes bacterium]